MRYTPFPIHPIPIASFVPLLDIEPAAELPRELVHAGIRVRGPPVSAATDVGKKLPQRAALRHLAFRVHLSRIQGVLREGLLRLEAVHRLAGLDGGQEVLDIDPYFLQRLRRGVAYVASGLASPFGTRCVV